MFGKIKIIFIIGLFLMTGVDFIFVQDNTKGIKWTTDDTPYFEDIKIKDTGIKFSGKSFGIQFYKSCLVFSKKIFSGNRDKKYFQLYKARSLGNGFGSSVSLFKNLDSKSNIGGFTFSADGKTLFYTQEVSNRKGDRHFKIVEAKLDDGEWKKTKRLLINGKGFSCAFPALSPDEQALYFCSDKPGGYGGIDLYVSYRSIEGWGKPINLGKTINSSRDEVYPYLAGENTLYFASNGHVGLGGLDIFLAKKNAWGNWGSPKNMGEPINSSQNDYSYITNPHNEGSTYFVSDRFDRGIHDRIFKVEVTNKEIFKIIVRDEITGYPIQDALVRLVRIFDNKEIKGFESGNSKGEYRFELNRKDVEDGIKFQVSAVSSKYKYKEVKYKPEPHHLNLNLTLEPVNQEFKIALQPILYPNRKFIFHNIYFKTNTFYLTSDSRIVLNRLINLLKTYPDVKLKLNAHTDSRGEAFYNKRLSLKRAKTTKDYLVSKGIDSEIIEIRGYGEKYILNECVNGFECGEKQHEYNRRLEVIVVL